MKIVLLVICSLLILPFSSIAQDDTYSEFHLTAAVRLLDDMNMQKTLDKTIDAALEVQLNQMPEMKSLEGVMRDFFNKYMSYEAMKEDLANLYAKYYTEKELKQLGKFYRSEVGKKVAAVTPELTAESMTLGQNVVQENMAELQEAIMKKMAEDEKD